ncbi:MAG: putative transposase, partial [Methanofollis sp.]|nr:putative transposase [Methanofollis sp.]
TPTMRGTQARIVTLKDENPSLKGVYSRVLQMVNDTLWSNIAALSQTKKRGRKIGKLRFDIKLICRCEQDRDSREDFDEPLIKGALLINY